MRRWASLAVLAVILVAFTLIAPASSAQQHKALGHHVRFDLVQIVQGTALAGGTDTGRDAARGDTVALTGSGEFEPGARQAAGGGTFVHQDADGRELEHGVWLVTGFVSWAPADGFLPSSLTDGIGEVSEASAGIVTLHVELRPSQGGSVPATLSVNGELPGASFPIEEGITLAVGPFDFEQHGGLTLFHVLQ